MGPDLPMMPARLKGPERVFVRVLLAILAGQGVTARAPAQDRTGADHRLSVLAGLASVDERDALASPIRYSGAAKFLQIGYVTADPRRVIAIRLGLENGILASPATDPSTDLPHQESLRVWVEAEYVHRLGSGDRPFRWRAGGVLAVHVMAVDHFYATGSDFGYGLISASLAPAVSVTHPVGERSSLSARLAIPLVALVGRPYGDTRLVSVGGLPLNLGSVNRFQSADLSAGFTTPLSGGLDFTLGYHLTVERLEGSDPVRYAAQALTVEIGARLGGGS